MKARVKLEWPLALIVSITCLLLVACQSNLNNQSILKQAGKIILTEPVPGMVALGPGPQNGYLNAGNTGFISGIYSGLNKNYGIIAGYIRTWVSIDPVSSVAIEMFEFSSTQVAQDAYISLKQALIKLRGSFLDKQILSTSFLGSGLALKLASVQGSDKITAYQSSFVVKNAIFIVQLESLGLKFSSKSLKDVSLMQYNWAYKYLPNSSPKSLNSYFFFVPLVIVVLIMLFAVWWWGPPRNKRRRRTSG